MNMQTKGLLDWLMCDEIFRYDQTAIAEHILHHETNGDMQKAIDAFTEYLLDRYPDDMECMLVDCGDGGADIRAASAAFFLIYFTDECKADDFSEDVRTAAVKSVTCFFPEEAEAFRMQVHA